MNKQAEPNGNSVTRLPIPLVGDINNRRFMTAVLAGVLGGAGVSSAANLLRQFVEMRQKRKDETNDDTIVLNLPAKAASAAGKGYESMNDSRPGESSPTANGGTQLRVGGRFGSAIRKEKSDAPAPKQEKTVIPVKKADGNPGPNTVGTVVANALGLTAGGLLSYEVVSRLFDRMNERRLKKKLEAAQQAYVSALSGSSKRAEAVNRIIRPVCNVIMKSAEMKSADVVDVIRYPAAAYILALLAGTGATAYVTKKVMDREFPEEKLKRDVNRPTRIVFRTAPGTEPTLNEGAADDEKKASAETCAAVTAMLPIYMDVVEGQPSRTLAEPYQKIAEAAGTDAAGLMKMAKDDMWSVYKVLLQNPKSILDILVGTRFGLNFSKLRAANVLKETNPDVYRRAVDAAIDSHWAGGPNDGLFRKAYNSIGKAMTKAYSNLGGRDSLVESALAPKAAEADSLLRAGYIGSSIFKEKEPEPEPEEPDPPKEVIQKAKARLKDRRRVTVETADGNAAAFVKRRGELISKLLARLNAQGRI